MAVSSWILKSLGDSDDEKEDSDTPEDDLAETLIKFWETSDVGLMIKVLIDSSVYEL